MPIVSLSGDINVAEAKALMEKYFGAIPRGPVNTSGAADVPTLAAPKTIVMKDRIPAVEIQRHWAVPGLQSPQLAALDLGASVLGGLASSRLDKILVRDEKIATSVSADMQPFHRVGFMEIDATVKPGVDPALVAKRLDEVVADYLANGPTEDELQRAATQVVAGRHPRHRARRRARTSRLPKACSTTATATFISASSCSAMRPSRRRR